MSSNRREFLSQGMTASLALLGGVGAASFTHAASAAAQTYRVGDRTVTALLDGHFDIEPAVITGATPDEIDAAYKNGMRSRSPEKNPVNAYLIRDESSTILVDTGSGGLLGPTAGNLVQALELAGAKPSDVNTILLTHMHPDHIGGLVGAGAKLFSNAELVVHAADHAFWTDEQIAAQAGDFLAPFFAAARSVSEDFSQRLRLFEGDQQVVDGITPINLAGHTPGHTGFVLDADDPLLVWGDVVHAVALQVANPDWGVAFDVDGVQARTTRHRVLDMAAADQLKIAGMHVDFPGVGRVSRDGEAYSWHPEPYDYSL